MNTDATPRSFLVFLTYPAYMAPAGDGKRWLQLHARERNGFFADPVCLGWTGPDADAFFKAHADDLKPGRALNVDLHHIKAGDGQVRARITSCTLAPLPPSWIKHQAKQTPTTTGATTA